MKRFALLLPAVLCLCPGMAQDLLPPLPPQLLTARITVDPAQIEDSLKLPAGGEDALDLRSHFQESVPFPEGASLVYDPLKAVLVHVNTRANQEKLGEILIPPVPPAQVQVEATVVRQSIVDPGEPSPIQTLRVMTLSGVAAMAEDQQKEDGHLIRHTRFDVTPTVAKDGSVACQLVWVGRAPGTGKGLKQGLVTELALSNLVTCVDGKPMVAHERLLPGGVLETLVLEVALVDDRGIAIRDLPPSIVYDEAPEPIEEEPVSRLQTIRVGVPGGCDGAALTEQLRTQLNPAPDAELRWDKAAMQLVHRNEPNEHRRLITLLARMCPAPVSPQLKLEIVRVPVAADEEGETVNPLDETASARRLTQFFTLPAASGQAARQTASQILLASGSRQSMEIELTPLVDTNRKKAHVAIQLKGTMESDGERRSEMAVNASVVVRDGVPALVHKRQIGAEFECLVLTCDLVDREGRAARQFPYGFAIETE